MNIKLPFTYGFKNIKDFFVVERFLADFNKDIKFKEMGWKESKYIVVFYVGEMPNLESRYK